MAIGGGGPITNFSQQAMEQQLALYNVLLLRGADNGSLNRDEFIDLNSDQNAIAQLRDSFEKSDGISPEEQLLLDARQLAYANKLQKYREGDYQPVPNEATLADKELNEAAGEIYDGVREGTVSGQEGMQLLYSQREIAAKSLSSNPVDQQVDLQTHEMDIKDARREREPKDAPSVPTPHLPVWEIPQSPLPGVNQGPDIRWSAAAKN